MCPVLQIYTLNFFSQCWIGSLLVTGWLLGEGDWPLLYNFRGGLVQVLYNVTWWMGCLKSGWNFVGVICVNNHFCSAFIQ